MRLGNKKTKKQKKQEKQRRNRYFAKSAFIGNSISVGLKMYFDSQGADYLGNPVMLVKGSYSFQNDKGANSSKYQLNYKGRVYKAKDAIKAAKVKRVFISMGTNDLWKPAEDTYKDYVEYIKGIRKKNPDVVIFVQSTTPMCSSRNGKYLNNTAINTLNKKMKQYCAKRKNMYYVDVTKGMKDGSGGLKRQYSSDGFVHMSMSGYKVWTNNLIRYVDDLLEQEEEATAAVQKASKTKKYKDYQKANQLVKALETSTTREKLRKQLKKIKKQCNKEFSGK